MGQGYVEIGLTGEGCGGVILILIFCRVTVEMTKDRRQDNQRKDSTTSDSWKRKIRSRRDIRESSQFRSRSSSRAQKRQRKEKSENEDRER
jgi:hypothetical protein